MAKHGRLVRNHSSFVDGLLPVLQELKTKPGIKSITPGRIGKTKGISSGFYVTVSVKTITGWKLIVRRGRNVQECFINCQGNMTSEKLTELINESMKKVKA
jgi:hypothetical protein